MNVVDIPQIDRLSMSEKILLVEDLWDSIILDKSTMPVPKSHMKELDRRLKNYASNPKNLLSLEELQVRIEQRR